MTAAAPSGAAAVNLQGVHAGGDVRIVVDGVVALSVDYATRLNNFFREYLGSPDHPVPFGGRGTDLAQLDRWLDDPKGPQRLLVAAPAGRGKSALLVRWSQHLLERDGLNLAFMPVSIRFRTNLASVVLSTLCARLAAIHGDPVPGSPDLPAEAWRTIFSDYLARPLTPGTRLIVILDGVDEAADWAPGPDLFPLELPDGLRLVVSARYLGGDGDAGGWLRRLGWEQSGVAKAIDLSTLNKQGVGDVLSTMGLPLDRLAADVDLVTELHRLSEGDPLLVRLYVEDIWSLGESAARLRPEDLASLSPGLEGYFNRWWDDQSRLWGPERPLRERSVQFLLNLMACSLGPLTREDILDHLATPEDSFSAWSLDEALRPLGRFVLGDGRSQGYTFSHPRLSIYFHERLTPGEQHQIEGRFQAWGETTLQSLAAATVKPETVSPYLVQYLSTHLARANSDAGAFRRLVSDGWSRAWFSLEGSYSGFLGDLRRAWSRMDGEDRSALEHGGKAVWIGDAVRCALGEASIRSLARNLPPALLHTLVERKLWSPTQALAYARQAPLLLRIETFASLMPMMPDSVRSEVLGEALGMLRRIALEDERVEALAHLAPRLRPDDEHNALAVNAALDDVNLRAEALSVLAPHLSAGPLDRALAIARGINDRGVQMQALAAIAPHQPASVRSRLLREVLDNTREIGDDLRRVSVLREFAGRLPVELWPEARRAIADLAVESLRGEVMAYLLPQFTGAHADEVLADIRSLRGAAARARALLPCIEHLGREMRPAAIDEALGLKDSIDTCLLKAQVLAELARCVGEPRRLELKREALEIIDQLAGGRRSVNEARAVEVIAALAAGSDPALVARLFALSQGRLLSRSMSKGAALTALAPHLPENLLNEAVDVLDDFKNSPQAFRSVAVGLVPHLPEHLRGQVYACAEAISDSALRRQTLGDLAKYQDNARLRLTLANIRAIGDEQAALAARAALGASLSGQPTLEALDAAEAIEDESRRARLVAALGPAVASEDPRRLIAAVTRIGSESARAEAISGLASKVDSGVLREFLATAASMIEFDARHRALSALVKPLGEQEVLDAVHKFTAPYWHDSTLRTLRLPRSHFGVGSHFSRLLGDFRDGYAGAMSLAELLQEAPDLPAPLAIEALRAICKLGPEDDVWQWDPLAQPLKAQLAAALTQRLPNAGLPDGLLIPVLSAVRYAGNDADTSARIEATLPHYLSAQLPGLSGPLAAIGTVLERLSSEQLRTALDYVRTHWYGEPLCFALLHGASRMANEQAAALIAEVLDIARTSLGEAAGASIILEAVRRCGPALPLRRALLAEALERSRRVNDGARRAELLTQLAGELPDPDGLELLREAGGAARSTMLAPRRYRALLAVALHSRGPERDALLDESISAALAITTDGRRAAALEKLLPHLPAHLHDRVLDACDQFSDLDSLARMLAAFAATGSSAPTERLLRVIATSLDESAAARVIAHLPESLSAAGRLSAAKLSAAIEDAETRGHALSALLPRLLELPPAVLHAPWCETLRSLSSRGRAQLLADLAVLAPVIIRLGGEPALLLAWSAIDELRSGWP